MKIGKYKVIRRLGKGGMGSVYKVCPPDSNDFFALKVLDPFEIMIDIIGFTQLKKIFSAESEMMKRINSSAVVRVHDIGEDDRGRPFFVMDFFCKNLGEMLGEGFWMDRMSRVIPPVAVLKYGGQLITGLSHLHKNNIIHRDIKPFNILVSKENTIKICDFGMALDNGKSMVGDANMIIGSPFYAAPEQNKQADTVDGRADLYATAVILFRMLTGLFPSKRLFPLSRINPLLNTHWDRFFKKGLQPHPRERFQDYAHMLEALDLLQHNCAEESTLDEWPGLLTVETPLRSKPAHITGSNVRDILEVSDQQQPLFFFDTPLTVSKNNKTVTDHTHSLLWQRKASVEPLDIAEANIFLQHLNNSDPAPARPWRLPTISELLSLLRPGRHTLLSESFSARSPWLWSCDLYGNLDHCYLDCAMGFIGHQDIHCRNSILAVASL